MYYYEELNDIWFLTVTNVNWRKLIALEEYKEIISGSLNHMVVNNRCNVYGFVFMPNHIHLLLRVPFETKPAFQRDFLKFTSQNIIFKMRDFKDSNYWTVGSTQSDRIRQIWERRPRWVPIATSKIFFQKLNYMHNNPLQENWNLVKFPEEYYWSSCKSYLQMESLFPFLSLYEF